MQIFLIKHKGTGLFLSCGNQYPAIDLPGRAAFLAHSMTKFFHRTCQFTTQELAKDALNQLKDYETFYDGQMKIVHSNPNDLVIVQVSLNMEEV